MARDYVEEHSGAYLIAGTRVSLDSVVYAFLPGESPGGDCGILPGAYAGTDPRVIGIDLANREKIEQYLCQGRADFERLRQEARQNNPSVYARLVDARRRFQLGFAPL